jgi:hypothetical protein
MCAGERDNRNVNQSIVAPLILLDSSRPPAGLRLATIRLHDWPPASDAAKLYCELPTYNYLRLRFRGSPLAHLLRWGLMSISDRLSGCGSPKANHG